MCGIAGIHVRNPKHAKVNLDALAMSLLLGIEHRGKDATGYAAMTVDGQVQTVRAACKASEFIAEAPMLPNGTQSVILHTRLATQGHHGFMHNNHPVECANTLVVHNGHIFNDDEVIKLAGFERQGRVDSEAIPQVIEHYGWEQAMPALEKLDGGFAIAALNRTRPGEVLLAKGAQSPLYVYVSSHLVVWASTKEAIEKAWTRHVGTFAADKVRAFNDGDAMRLNGSQITSEDFVPLWIPLPAYTSRYAENYTPPKAISQYTGTPAPYSWDDPDAEGELEWDDDLNREVVTTGSGYRLSPKLERALAMMHRRMGNNAEREEEGTPTIVIPSTRVQTGEDDSLWIACASCNDLTEMEDMEGEDDLYCWSCWTHIENQGMRG